MSLVPVANPATLAAKHATLTVQPAAAYSIGAPSNATVIIEPWPVPAGTGLLGEYFDNASSTYANPTNFTGLKLTRVDPVIHFGWGSGRPYPTVSRDNFSARWETSLWPGLTGNHEFELLADDGARLYLAEQLVLDAWTGATNPVVSAPVALTAGSNYTIRVEYHELTNAAAVRLRWRVPGANNFVVIPTANLLHPTLATNRWSASYFNNATLTGPPVTNALESSLNYFWNTGSPDPAIEVDTFSIRWTGQVKPEHTEPYSFHIYSDDGVKLWVDGQLLIDRWSGGGQARTGTVALVGGVRYDIQLEYFENTLSATNALFWWSPSQTRQIIPQERLYPATNAGANVTSPRHTVGLVGGPFFYQLRGSNLPGSFTVSGLPPGLVFDVGNGTITGTPTVAGQYQVLICATNNRGTGYAVLDLTIIDTGRALTYELWTGVAGQSVTNIPVNTPATTTNTLSSLQGPTNAGDNFGARIRGYLTPPVTGNYRFWIASDGPSEFWLATDDEPANKVRRCTVTNATAALTWDTEPNQRSHLIRLQAGQRYYLEVLHKEATGPDHVAVGWRPPGAAGSGPSEVVPGYVLSPFTAAAAAGEAVFYVATLTPQSGAQSSGSGFSTLKLAPDELSAEVALSYGNLTTLVTGMHIHHAGYGGAIIFDLDDALPANGVYHWEFVPSGGLSVADIVAAIKSGQAYVNVHTAQYPAGEIAGTYLLGAGAETFTPPAEPPALPGGPPPPQDIIRFLTQATFGPTTGGIAEVQALGFDGWINQQMALPATSHRQYVDNYFLANPTAATNATPVWRSWWQYVVTAPDQLRLRTAFALSEIFVVSQADTSLQNQPWALTSYYDLLATHAFGNARQLLEEVTLHPAMGLYLDMLRNEQGDPATGRSPNENYAREILQLFSIGLKRLHPDGTLKLTRAGLPTPTYDQDAIVGFARVFTGWNYNQTGQSWNPPADYLNPMTLVSNRHDTVNEKLLLDNVVLPAGQDGGTDLHAALELIFQHPNFGPFLCRQLIQRLVTSNPSPGYIYRVARVFDDNSSGERGDLGAVVRAILLDYEARSTDLLDRQGYGHQREPVLRTTAAMRAFNPVSVSGNWTLGTTDSDLAQTPLRSPTVFNFFELDYVRPGDIAAAGLCAPEFQITSETSTINSHNFFRGGIYNTSGFKNDVRLDLTFETGLAGAAAALVEHLNQKLMAGQMSGRYADDRRQLRRQPAGRNRNQPPRPGARRREFDRYVAGVHHPEMSAMNHPEAMSRRQFIRRAGQPD